MTNFIQLHNGIKKSRKKFIRKTLGKYEQRSKENVEINFCIKIIV